MSNKYFFRAVVLLIGASIMIASCKKESETLSGTEIKNYFPLQTGKYITYKLDSTVFINSGSVRTVRSYEVKYLVDSLLKDNLNRDAYRIIRYIRKDNTRPWQSDNTFWAVNTGSSLEWVENNLRFIKLTQPIRESFTWKGNRFIDTQSPTSLLKYLDDWNYEYVDVQKPLQLGSYNLVNTITVNQQDKTDGDITIGPGSIYQEVNFSKEKYAEGLGMVYRKFLHTVWQQNNGGYYEDGSYGVELTMIDHN